MKLKLCILILVLSLATACAPAAWQPEPETPAEATTPPGVAPTGTSTEITGLIPGPELDYDCSKVEHLLPDSPEATKIVQEFVDNFKAQWPTEYMAMETLWSVDRLGEYAIILGEVTSDERDAIVVQQTPQGYKMVSRFIVTWGVSSRYTIPEYFAEQLPEAPMELFYCMDVSRVVENAPAQELDLNREYDCSILETVPVDGPEGKAISQVLLDFQRSGSVDRQVELEGVHSITRSEPYLAVQSRFRSEGRLEPPVLFILKADNGSYKVIGAFMGPTLSRKGFLREVYAEAPEVPAELLACLELDWFFPQITPTPSMATPGLRVTWAAV